MGLQEPSEEGAQGLPTEGYVVAGGSGAAHGEELAETSQTLTPKCHSQPW